ncbi:MAG: acetolactate decarboxylase [Candidatus Paceibacterota bacterium]
MKIRNFNFTVVVACVLLISCKYGETREYETELKENSVVNYIGAMRNVMRKGELFGTIQLDTISNFNHLYGLGPVEYLKGEILVFDGKSYVSNVINDTTMQVIESRKIKAPFFVYANVEEWKEIKFPDSIQTIPQLEVYLDNISKKLQRPFPVKITAIVETADIHIVNLPEGTEVHSPEEAHQEQKNYPLENEQVVMLGFFSTEHQAVFTHHDSYVHIHLITSDKLKMGHLDDVMLKKGTVKFFLPK